MTAALPIPRPAADPNAWQLVERAQAGDRDAFADIYKANYDNIFKFIYFKTGNHAVAQDLTADVFERALRNISNVSWQGRDIAAWLNTIARNRMADHFKSARYRYELAASDLLDHDDRNATEPDAASEATAFLRVVALLTALGQLTDEQREVVVLRFFGGLSVLETAEVMGKTDAAVKAMTHRATQSLGRDPRVQELGVAA